MTESDGAEKWTLLVRGLLVGTEKGVEERGRKEKETDEEEERGGLETGAKPTGKGREVCMERERERERIRKNG